MTAIGGAILGLAGLAVLALIGGRRQGAVTVVYGGCSVISALLALLGLIHLLGGTIGSVTAAWPVGLPGHPTVVRIDALSAFFLVVVNLSAAAACLFGIDSDRPGHDDGHGTGRFLPLFPLFLAGMNLVLIADDAFAFLFGWEFMSLSSWLLVLSAHREPSTSRAAYVYLVMAGIGTAALLLAFGLLAGGAGGQLDFAAMRTAPLSTTLASIVFALVLVGAGSKAGLVPLHVWLPLAHPAAPAHVSALMSGAMTKVAIYGLIRILFDLIGQPNWWWGVVLLLLGGLTAVGGVLQALMQRDLKAMLAYSTVENIGIITIGLGLTLAFQASGMKPLAALALTAALFHVLNHAIFKSLLFLGVGSVLAATGERDMDQLGGLIHRMPVTAPAFLVGCMAIAGLPPLNGFVSEWLTFQSVLRGADLVQWPLRIAVPLVGALLALAVALAAGAFVRGFGISFLGRARSSAAAAALEVRPCMQIAVAALAGLCLLIGILPTPILHLIGAPVAQITTVPLTIGNGLAWLAVPSAADHGGSYNGLVLVVIGVAFMVGVVGVARGFGRSDSRRAIPWGCGFSSDPGPIAQYTASSFAQPIRRVFGSVVFSATETVTMPKPGETRAARFTVSLRDPAWDWLFTPLVGLLEQLTRRIGILQTLTIRHYLSLMLAALVAMMSVVILIQ